MTRWFKTATRVMFIGTMQWCSSLMHSTSSKERRRVTSWAMRSGIMRRRNAATSTKSGLFQCRGMTLVASSSKPWWLHRALLVWTIRRRQAWPRATSNTWRRQVFSNTARVCYAVRTKIVLRERTRCHFTSILATPKRGAQRCQTATLTTSGDCRLQAPTESTSSRRRHLTATLVTAIGWTCQAASWANRSKQRRLTVTSASSPRERSHMATRLLASNWKEPQWSTSLIQSLIERFHMASWPRSLLRA
mmetsp:Transcript_86629/g.242683  ORF Transcript_86629/g.242683 Transcript_86629/m.242683 type:complete len:248 (-) Transcript_86629:1115-1858(-)